MNRNKVLKIVLLSVVGIIAVRLFWIQIIEHNKWQGKADEQQTLTNTIIAKRGEIYMMDGANNTVPVAMNETVWTVIVDPMITDEEQIKKVVDENANDKKVAEWEDVFADKERRYYVVARDVERKAAEKIKEAKIKGVWLQENTKRIYPEGKLASRLLGFVNAEGVGQYGVEGSLNDDLSGKNGLLKTVKDINNVALSIGDDNVKIPAQDGKTVVLSVDRNMQYGIEKRLTDVINNSVATNASAIVMNPRNGQILAMANVPNYDPANYSDVENANTFINYTVEEPYEPASVCKTFAFAAAVNEGLMDGSTTFNNTGSVVIDGATIENAHKGHLGTIDMQTVLGYSLNTGSIQALRLLSGSTTDINESGRQKLYDYYYNKFGLGQYTGIELLESPGLIVGPNDGYAMDLTYANMTFGQGLNLTMTQVASAFSSVINGGKYYTPTIIAGEMKNNKFVKNEPKEAVRQVVSEQTSSKMREMLHNIRSLFYANRGDQPGFYIGGKTGTAQVIRDGKYTDAMGETIANYIGFGGSEGELPEYVIMVKIWAEGKHMEGERDAMPVFNSLNSFVQDYLKIKPKG